jgi:hypothetical protein
MMKKQIKIEIDGKHINDIQLNSIKLFIERAQGAHFIDIRLRINGRYEFWQADYLRYLTISHPQRRITHE